MQHYNLPYSLFKFLLAAALILWGCGGNSDSTNNIPNNASDITDNASSSSKETNSILCNEGETLTDGIVTYICSDQKWIQQEITQQCTEGESFTGGSFIYTCFGGQWITQEEPSQTKGSSSSTTKPLENTNSSSSVKAKSSSSIKKSSSSSSNTNCKDGESRKIYFDDLYIADVCKNGTWKYPSTSCDKTGPTIVETLETIIINGVSYTSYCYNNTLYFKKTCKEGDRDTITENGVLRARVCSAYGLWTTLNGAVTKIETGSFIDPRDFNEYKTVIIGNQTWMAENLRYEEKDYSTCYNINCDSTAYYGRLYKNIGNACPIGWHVPNNSEWNTLISTVGDSTTAGTMLKSKSNWNNKKNGTDLYGFSALPAGYIYLLHTLEKIGPETWSFEYISTGRGIQTIFWSSTKKGEFYYTVSIGIPENEIHFGVAKKTNIEKKVGFSYIDEYNSYNSIRCLKD